MKSVVLYLHAHQPHRIKPYTIFDSANDHSYFNSQDIQTNNQAILHKVARKSYLPTNKALFELLQKFPDFKLSLSITGTLLEQLESWEPDVLQSFKTLCSTGQVEILAETYHHSLAFFYNYSEFETQVQKHSMKIQELFGQTPRVFRNTELAYNNELAQWADAAGFAGILAEGWEDLLGSRSPNYLYHPSYTSNIRLLLKNYHLSDDIAFRFGDRNWSEWPLTADKFIHWIDAVEGDVINLFMDYETFGEHQWMETGIFEFLGQFVGDWQSNPDRNFSTVSEAISQLDDHGEVNTDRTITWADTERDLSAWTGNAMQQQAIHALYDLSDRIIGSNNQSLISDWRALQTSDHFYYMCTKYFNDGDVHAYFSPYDNPYEAFIYFMNVYHDLLFRLTATGTDS